MAAVALMTQTPREVSTPPDWLRLRIALSPDTVMPELMTALVDDFLHARGISVSVIEDQIDAGGDTLEVERGAPAAADYRDPGLRDLVLRLNRAGTLHALRYDQTRPGSRKREAFNLAHCISLQWFDALDGATTQRVSDSLNVANAMVAFLRTRFDILELSMTRQDRVGVCPSPPLAPPNVLMQTVRNHEVASHYGSSVAYWSAWDTRAPLNDQTTLVTRQVDTIDAAAFAQRIFAAQWTLARATTTPNQTSYANVLDAATVAADRLTPGHQALWSEGDESLTGFHYSADSKTLEVTAWTEPGSHIAPRDIGRLLAWRLNGRFDGGQVVERVRVTFPTRDQAMSQARVLFDIGCQVCFCGDSPTDTVELKDA